MTTHFHGQDHDLPCDLPETFEAHYGPSELREQIVKAAPKPLATIALLPANRAEASCDCGWKSGRLSTREAEKSLLLHVCRSQPELGHKGRSWTGR